MALTGLGFCLFVLIHMAGNLLIFVSPEAYNKYGYQIVSNPFIYVAEAGLVLFFLIHIVKGIRLTLLSKSARPQRYAVQTSGDKAASFASKTMIHQGVVIGVFAVYHLITFKFGPHYTTTIDGAEMRDLFKLMVEVFEQPLYVAGYIFALVILGFHLSHGFSSALQTLGINHPHWTPCFKKAGWAYAALVSVGFISQPIYIFFFHR